MSKQKKIKDIPILHIKEKGNPFYVENRVGEEYINDSKFIKWIYRAIDLFKEGKTKQTVFQVLEEECKGKIESTNLNDIVISRARQLISLEYQKNDKFVIGLHLQRYKKEIESLREKIKRTENKTKIDPHTKQQIINSYYYDILDLMYHQEKLLQLHNKKVVLRINQINNTYIERKSSKFNLNNLTFEEKKEFLQLVLKSKRTDNEIYGVKLLEKEENKEEIEDAEIVEEKVNVDSIKVTEEKIVEEKQEGVALFDAFEKLRKTFEEKAKQEFEKVGGKI